MQGGDSSGMMFLEGRTGNIEFSATWMASGAEKNDVGVSD